MVCRRPSSEAAHGGPAQPEVTWVRLEHGVARLARSRKIVRTMTSAATNSRTRACTMRTTSIDRPALLLHEPGARRASSPKGPR